MISAQEEYREPGTGARLKRLEVGFVRGKGIAYTHILLKNTAHGELKSEKIQAKRASSKATRRFLLMQQAISVITAPAVTVISFV